MTQTYHIAMKVIKDRIMQLMKSHVGHSKGVTKQHLFNSLFHAEYNPQHDISLIRWEFVSRALSELRKRSTCFIVRETSDKKNISIYYVLKSLQEVRLYSDACRSRIKGHEYMQERARRAHSEQWYKKPFVITK